MHKLTLINQNIPQFSLYGEFSNSETQDFIHFEKICDRSSVNDWVISPHRHNELFQIVCVFSGEFKIQFDGCSQKHSGGCLITIPSETVHGFLFHPETLGYVISVSTDLVSGSEKFKNDLLDKDMLLQLHLININDDSYFKRRIKNYINLIRMEIKNRREDQMDVLLSLINILLLLIKGKIREGSSIIGNRPANVNFVNHFRALINENYKKQWRVSDYAEAMNMSVSTLNRFCNSSFDNSAKNMVQERLIVEAKRELMFTSMPINKIALSLGFNNSAYFSRIFRKIEGVSPFQYRVTVQAN